MLQLKRDGATVEDYPPAGEIVTTDRINRVAGVLMSYVAGRVYGIDIPAGEYAGAVADMQLLYRTIDRPVRPRRARLSCSRAWCTIIRCSTALRTA